MPSGPQNEVALMCWMVRALPSASVMTIRAGRPAGSSPSGVAGGSGSVSPSGEAMGGRSTGSSGSPSHYGSLKCS